MVARGPGIAIGIEFGQLSTGLSAILGMGRGLTAQKGINRAMGSMARQSAVEFGRVADAAGAAGEIAHVYEYGQEGTIGGRLWSLTFAGRAGDTVGNISFRAAELPTSVGAGIDERLASAASAAGRTIAGHYFPDKANHLETTQVLVSEAGRQEHTTRVGGDVERPRVLVYIDRNGDVRFAKRRRRENEFYKKFEALFTTYWAEQMVVQAKPKVHQGFKNAANFGAGRTNASIRRMAGIRPRIPAGLSGVFATDRGKPYTGIRLRQNEVSSMQKQVEKQLTKELVNQWRR